MALSGTRNGSLRDQQHSVASGSQAHHHRFSQPRIFTDQRGDLRPGIGTLVTGYGQPFLSQRVKAGLIGQAQDRNEPGGRHEVRVIE